MNQHRHDRTADGRPCSFDTGQKDEVKPQEGEGQANYDLLRTTFATFPAGDNGDKSERLTLTYQML